MSDRDDAPPGEAVNAISAAESAGVARLRALRTLPAAALVDLLAWLAASLPKRDRWRAAARLADGLEPTREMVVAGQDEHDDCVDHGFSSDADGNRHDYTYISPAAPSKVFAAMLAAAREAGDAE